MRIWNVVEHEVNRRQSRRQFGSNLERKKSMRNQQIPDDFAAGMTHDISPGF